MITLELTQEQASALHTFLWTASIPWNSVGPTVSRSAIYSQLLPIEDQLSKQLAPPTPVS